MALHELQAHVLTERTWSIFCENMINQCFCRTTVCVLSVGNKVGFRERHLIGSIDWGKQVPPSLASRGKAVRSNSYGDSRPALGPVQEPAHALVAAAAAALCLEDHISLSLFRSALSLSIRPGHGLKTWPCSSWSQITPCSHLLAVYFLLIILMRARKCFNQPKDCQRTVAGKMQEEVEEL